MKQKLLLFCMAAALAFFAHDTLTFILAHSLTQPSYVDPMVIDSAFYLNTATSMAESGDLGFTPHSRHSVAIQSWFALLLKLFPGQGAAPLKIANFLLWLALLGLLYRLGWAATKRHAAALFIVLLAAQSESLRRYCAIAQHEVFGAFLATLAVTIAVCGGRTRLALTSLGGVLALLAFVRLHWIVLFPLLFFIGRHHGPLRRGNSALKHVAIGFLALAIPWNAYYTYRTGELFLFQKGYGFRYALHANSTGKNFPRTWSTDGVYGFRYIRENPLGYLSLLGKRAAYLVAWDVDQWHVPSYTETALSPLLPRPLSRRFAVLLALGLFFYGVWATLRAARHGRIPWESAWLPLGVPIVIALPQFAINASSRFLIPGIPIFAYYAGLGLWLRVSAARSSRCAGSTSASLASEGKSSSARDRGAITKNSRFRSVL